MYKSYSKNLKLGIPPSFGQEMRVDQFGHFPTDLVQFNHGAYGNVPKNVMDRYMQKLWEYEGNIMEFVKFTDKELRPQEAANIAQFLGANPSNLAFVENTTSGINTILKALQFKQGEIIVENRFTYGAVTNQIQEIRDRIPGVQSLSVDIPFPLESAQQVLDAYEEVLQQHPNARVAIIDHISSMPMILFPVKELTSLCHRYNVLTIIDGAHCPGHIIDLNIEDIGADFYIGNIHKWMYAVRGTAILCVAPQFHDIVKPMVTSFEYFDPFPENHIWWGTRDNVAFVTCSAAIDFINWIGGLSSISEYITSMKTEAFSILSEGWGTGLMPIPSDMQPPFVLSMQLPAMAGYDTDEDGSSRLYDDIYFRFNIWSPVKGINEKHYVRISLQIYSTTEEVERLRDAILILKDEIPDSEQQKQSKEKFAKLKPQNLRD